VPVTVWAADGRLGAADCERFGTGTLAQPVNAVTSLAYVAVGVIVVIAAARTGRRHAESAIYAACLVAVGLGSFAFHGPQPIGSQPAHDLPILLTLAFIVAYDLDSLSVPGGRRSTFAVAAVASVAVTIRQDLVVWFIGGLGALAVVLERFVHWRGRRAGRWPTPPPPPALAMLAVLAGLAWIGGRSSSLLCDAESPYQLHGLWHVLSAVVLGAWWWLAGARDDSRGSMPPPARSHHE